MKTYLLMNSYGEQIYLPNSFKELVQVPKALIEINSESSKKDGTIQECCRLIAEAIAEIRSTVPFVINNNRTGEPE